MRLQVVKQNFKKQNYLLLTVKTTAVKQLTKHPTKIVLDLLCIHSVCTLLSSNYCQPLISDAHKDLSHPPHFCITGGKHNSDRQICKDITVNDAPAFWLQATAIKIPLSKSKDHQLCTFIHTHYAEKQPQVKCKNDLVFSCSPFQKRCPIQNLWLPKDMKLQCRIFFMKEIAKHSKKHCNMFFFTAFCTPFPLYYLGNALDFLVTCAAPPLLVPFVR